MNYTGKKGIDIGDHNGDIDFAKIKDAGYDFVMIKMGNGSDIYSQDDSRFEENVKKAEEIGMPWGAWLYSYAINESEAYSEVEHIKRLLNGKNLSLPVALDMEDADGYKARHGALTVGVCSMVCEIVLSGIKDAGYYPMLYTGYSMKPYLTDKVLNMCDLWWAQWSTELEYTADNVGIWQYGGEDNYIESPYIDGICGKIDKDLMLKDYPAIIKNGDYSDYTEKAVCTVTFNLLAKSGYTNTGEQVKTVQRLLNSMDYRDSDGHRLDVDGIFGDRTDFAVRLFQRDNGLEDDGIVGSNTWKALTGGR